MTWPKITKSAGQLLIVELMLLSLGLILTIASDYITLVAFLLSPE